MRAAQGPRLLRRFSVSSCDTRLRRECHPSSLEPCRPRRGAARKATCGSDDDWTASVTMAARGSESDHERGILDGSNEGVSRNPLVLKTSSSGFIACFLSRPG